MAQVLISKKLLRDKDLMESLRFHYAVDPQNFIKAFNEAGIAIDESNITGDFEKLVLASTHSKDVNGTFLTKRDGTPFKFSVLSILMNAEMDHSLLDKKAVFDKSNPYLIINT